MQRFPVVVLCLAMIVAAAGALAQEAAPSTTTDPEQIAAECGGDLAAGRPHFEPCAACHAVQAGDALPGGPHLESVFGRPLAAAEGFAYSPRYRLAAARDMAVWDRERMIAFLENPSAVAPELSVPHAAIADPQARRDLMTYLRTVTLPPPPKPGTVILPPEVLALSGDPAWGEYLAGDCMTCHQPHSAGGALEGLAAPTFVLAMHEYRLRARSHPDMQMVAAPLSNDEIAALAAWFAAQSSTH